MELRKDPITRSWIITGDDVPDNTPRAEGLCRFCADSPVAAQVVSNMPGVEGGPWSARALVHPAPLYRIEGEPARRADGIYDRMSPVGAHEVLVENLRHDRQLWNASDADFARKEQLLALEATDQQGAESNAHALRIGEATHDELFGELRRAPHSRFETRRALQVRQHLQGSRV